MDQTQNIKNGLSIYDKLSETYGIQDIIKDKLKSYLRKHHSIICHNNMVDEMKFLHQSFLLYFYHDEDPNPADLIRFIIHVLPEHFGGILSFRSHYLKRLEYTKLPKFSVKK